jgi:hypothetical protein
MIDRARKLPVHNRRRRGDLACSGALARPETGRTLRGACVSARTTADGGHRSTACRKTGRCHRLDRTARALPARRQSMSSSATAIRARTRNSKNSRTNRASNLCASADDCCPVRRKSSRARSSTTHQRPNGLDRWRSSAARSLRLITLAPWSDDRSPGGAVAFDKSLKE